MKVTLARALKERSRLAGKLKRDFDIINRENSVIRGSERSFDLRAVYAECRELHERLVALKRVIAAANAPIAGKLAEMDEIKSMISYLRGVNTEAGFKPRNYSSEKDLFEVVLDAVEMSDEAERLQKRAEELQDEIDVFNATTEVEVS